MYVETVPQIQLIILAVDVELGEDRWEVYDFKREKFCFATEVPWVRITVFGDRTFFSVQNMHLYKTYKFQRKESLGLKEKSRFTRTISQYFV